MVNQRPENIQQFLKAHPLFRNFSYEEIGQVLKLGLTEEQSFLSGEVAIALRSKIDRIGIVLEGRLLAARTDSEKAVHIITAYIPGDIIGLDGAFSELRISPVEVRAERDSSLLFLKINDIRSIEAFRERITDNILTVISEKGIQGMQRMDVLMGLTLRERIMTFMQSVGRQTGNEIVELEMTQAELARYLGVNRSTLSRELNRMKREGLIQILPKGKRRIMRWETKPFPNIPKNAAQTAASDQRDKS